MSESIQLFDTKSLMNRLKKRKLQSSSEEEIDPEVQVVDSFIRLTQSVIVELIPADDSYLEKKGFSWHIDAYSGNSIGIKLKFDHPKYISSTGIDILKVTYFKTGTFMTP